MAYRILTAPEKGVAYRTAGLVIIAILALIMALVAFYPPDFFLFENFFGYEYTGEFGILEDYTPYLVFTGFVTVRAAGDTSSSGGAELLDPAGPR